ncbi:hypothetical protein [Rhodoferax sp.]|uniref:hypothetical protein n=1 Tax=Rhodoferax sp. TaxID=50421 RepID=UPI0025F6A48C|nr:hypothetical protein [Rhodoferax sp.]
MNKPPTEREVLRRIYEMYESTYPGVHNERSRGENDPYLSIDVEAVAKKLNCKPELLFGYLYYHLDAKHRYQQSDGTKVHLFAIKVGNKRHGVNFPYLSAILANHDLEHRRQLWSIGLSMLALVLSAAAIVAQIVTAM